MRGGEGCDNNEVKFNLNLIALLIALLVSGQSLPRSTVVVDQGPILRHL